MSLIGRAELPDGWLLGSDVGEEPPGEVVELLVHGVSGTPPDRLLRYPPELVELCYGDANAGFYRRRDASPAAAADDLQEPTSPTDRRTGVVCEAFSWGRLTSGPATRALWVLFLPFVLVNLAHWMLPPTENNRGSVEGEPNTWASWSVRLLRVFGLTLSITLLLAMMSVVVDLVGWQCPDLPQCADRLGPLQVLSEWTPGMRLAATAAPVLAVVAVLLLIGKSNPRIGEPPPDAAERSSSPLTNPNFWNADRSVARLQGCHLTVWFSAIGALVLAASLTIQDASSRVPTTVLLVVHATFVSAGVVFTCWDRITARGGKGLDRDQSERPHSWPRWMWMSSMALSIASLGWVFGAGWYAARRNPGTKSTVNGPLPHLASATAWLMGVQVMLLLALWVATWLSRRSSAHLPCGYRPTLNGLTAPWVATLAWLIGGEASVAVGFAVARYLGQPVGSARAAAAVTRRNADALQAAAAGVIRVANRAESSSTALRDFVTATNASAPLQLSAGYFIASMVNLVVIAATIVIVFAAAVVTWNRGRTRVLDRTWRDYSGAAATEEAVGGLVNGEDKAESTKLAAMRTSRVKAISSLRAWAALTDDAPGLLASVIVVAAVAIAIVCGRVTFIYLSNGEMPSWLDGATARSGWTDILLIGQAVTAFIAIAVVGLAYQAFRNSETRRRVAVLWDVVTFWPHVAHPLGPPSYGERAVPDLWLRTTLLTRESKVVMAAHSQGSIIAAAALLINAAEAYEDLPSPVQPPLLARPMALLTFGSPLHRLYARNFPAYFGFDTLKLLETHARAGVSGEVSTSPRWLNLWALTDPIGGWILTEDLGAPPIDTPTGHTIDRRLLDAAALEPDDGRYPPICGHSGFWTRPEYHDAVEALATRIVLPLVEPGLASQRPAKLNLESRALADSTSRYETPFRLPGPGE